MKMNYTFQPLLLLAILWFIFSSEIYAQDNFQVKNSSNSVLMEVRNEGVLIKNVTTSERTTIAVSLTTSDNGLQVYDTQEKKIYIWKDTAWTELEDETNEIQNLSSVLSQSNDANAGSITNLADPVNAQDAATKAYVDALETKLNLLETKVSLLVVGNTVFNFNGQIWTGKNLNIEVPNSTCYNNDPNNCNIYGRLYSQSEAIEACALLGPGWQLPTLQEWLTLINFYGGIGGGSYNALFEGGSSGFDLKKGGVYSNSSNSICRSKSRRKLLDVFF